MIFQARRDNNMSVLRILLFRLNPSEEGAHHDNIKLTAKLASGNKVVSVMLLWVETGSRSRPCRRTLRRDCWSTSLRQLV